MLQVVINSQVYGQAEAPQDITTREAIAKAKADPNVAQVLAGYQITEET